MLTFTGFKGINNLAPAHRLTSSELLSATNVNIGLAGEITRRTGFAHESDQCHKNLHQARGFMLATCGGVLTAIHPDGTRYVIHPALGTDRVWYCNLPDGRTTYSNGLIHGVTDGVVGSPRSIDVPDTLGAPDVAFGELTPGKYRYHLTMSCGGFESPAISSGPITITDGGLRLDGLSVRLGYATNVYLSGLDGEGAYLIGSTYGSTFEWGGKNSDLVLPCRTLGAQAFPVGTFTAFWRGRVLTAVGNVLWASRSSAPHLADWQDFKQFAGVITAIVPVDDGIYVGTDQELVWLGGTTWEGLVYMPTARGPVVPGSGVPAPGDKIKLGDGVGRGSAMLCIAGGEVVAGFAGGQTTSLAGSRYRTTAKEVCATFRDVDGVPQYVAVPQ